MPKMLQLLVLERISRKPSGILFEQADRQMMPIGFFFQPSIPGAAALLRAIARASRVTATPQDMAKATEIRLGTAAVPLPLHDKLQANHPGFGSKCIWDKTKILASSPAFNVEA